jgi:hypothetical protein
VQNKHGHIWYYRGINYVVKLKILREKMERICQNIDALNKMRLKLKKKKIWWEVWRHKITPHF